MTTKFVDNIKTAAANLADATEAEMRLEDERTTHKLAAIDRIMSRGDNPRPASHIRIRRLRRW
jgi:hypothetical protein